MAEIKEAIQNGVSYGIKYTVTATDVTDGYVTIDFQANVDLSAQVLVTNQNGIVVSDTDVEITYPAAGKVKIGSNSTFALSAGQILNVTANRNVAEIYTYSA